MSQRSMLISLIIFTITIICSLAIGAHADPVGIWLFDEATGTKAKDFSGKKNDGIIHDLKWTKDSKFGSALVFEGKPGTWVEVPDSPSLDITDEITLMAWVFPTMFTGEWQRLVVKTFVGDVAPWMVYGFYEQGGSNGRTGFIISVDKGLEKRVGNGEPQLKLKDWNHLAAVYDGKEQRFYLNGEVKAKGPASGKLDTNDIPVSIGRNNVGNREHYQGLMDEVAIFNKALTEKEIQKIIKDGLATFTGVEPVGKLSTTWGEIKAKAKITK